jgi:hypothetical protein
MTRICRWTILQWLALASCCCILQVALDSFWSHALSTVLGNTAYFLMRSAMVRMTSTSSLGHIEGPSGHPGPLLNFDHCGYLLMAMQMVSAEELPLGTREDTLHLIQLMAGT